MGHPGLEGIDLGILIEAMYHFINILRVWNQVYLSRKKELLFRKMLSPTLGDRKKLFCWLFCLLCYSREEHYTCTISLILLSMLKHKSILL